MSSTGVILPQQSNPPPRWPGKYKINLFERVPLLKRIMHHRAFQFALVLPGLIAFIVVILAGIFGTPVGAKNFSIIFVWIVWWALLIVLLVPFGARVWCLACPIPALGEWIQRRALIANRLTRVVRRKWPKSLSNLWLANFGFLGIALFSALVTTRPIVTGLVLGGLMVLGIAISWVFERRSFCRYLCPVGGFLGLYSMMAPVEIRRLDPEVCRKCKFKSCYQGSTEASLQVGGEGGYGCPNFEFPGGGMERNTYCLMCTECIKACPYGNITLNARPFASDLLVPTHRKMDEAFKAFIMLGSALLYSIVMLGPYGDVKLWANLQTLRGFTAYALMFLGGILLLMPLTHLLFTWFAQLLSRDDKVPLEKMFVNYAYALVPLGLLGWIAFSVSFVLPNISYAISVISDPFGWGWNLFGTSTFPWTPFLPGLIPYLQIPILLIGLASSIIIAFGIARQTASTPRKARLAAIPITVYLTAITGLFFWLYLG
jgi:polyferredoxin